MVSVQTQEQISDIESIVNRDLLTSIIEATIDSPRRKTIRRVAVPLLVTFWVALWGLNVQQFSQYKEMKESHRRLCELVSLKGASSDQHFADEDTKDED